MFYVKNVPVWERVLRVAMAVALAMYGFLHLGGATGWVLIAGSVGMALSGIFGFCPACAMVGRRLDKSKG